MTEKEIEKIRAEEAQKYSLEGEAFGVETARDFLDGFDACLEKIARPALVEIDKLEMILAEQGIDFGAELEKKDKIYIAAVKGRQEFRNALKEARERIAELQAENEKLRAALKNISAAECPKHTAHPQSVWWITHVVKIAREALGKEVGR